MVMAVVDAAPTKCSCGSSPDKVKATMVPGIKLAGKPAATILDVNPSPNFGSCSIWAAKTLGIVTKCIPSVVPKWSPGAVIVKWNGMNACTQLDMHPCTQGGVITITDPGSNIIIA